MSVLPRPFDDWTTYPGHGGIDYPQPRGAIVRASGPGVIDFSGYYSARGGFAKFISYDCGCRHGYYHFDREQGLTKGDRVEYGQPFAFVGSLGQLSTGPHLHHEVWNGHSSIIKPPAYWSYVDKTRYVGDGAGAITGGGTVMATLDADDKAWMRLMTQQEIGGALASFLSLVKGDAGLTEDDKAWARLMTRQEIGGALGDTQRTTT